MKIHPPLSTVLLRLAEAQERYLAMSNTSHGGGKQDFRPRVSAADSTIEVTA